MADSYFCLALSAADIYLVGHHHEEVDWTTNYLSLKVGSSS